MNELHEKQVESAKKLTKALCIYVAHTREIESVHFVHDTVVVIFKETTPYDRRTELVQEMAKVLFADITTEVESPID